MDNYKKSSFSPKKIRPLGPVHLDWISDKLDYLRSPRKQILFFFIFLASKKLLAPLRSRIGTGSVFCHSFSVSPGVRNHWIQESIKRIFNSICFGQSGLQRKKNPNSMLLWGQFFLMFSWPKERFKILLKILYCPHWKVT